MEEYVKILTVDNEVKARLLETVLADRNIPFTLKSHHDTALDGLYQFQMGWGYLEAPSRFASEIREVYRDLSG
jgi:hypothetical protein